MEKNNYHLLCHRKLLMLLISMFLPFTAHAYEVVVADANGNELVYSYDAADGPATFKGIRTYAEDESKAGRIIIADRVTDGDGTGHDVLYVSGSVSNRSGLVSIVFGENIIATGGADGQQNDAFYNCQLLESVTLNAKLEILGNYTFQACPKLTSIDLTAAPNLKTIRYRCFENSGLTSIVIPAGIETFGDDIFGSCPLQSITFLAETVPADFFRYSQKLEEIHIGAGVKRIGNYAFFGSNGLTTLDIDEGVSGLTIGERAFSEADILSSVSLPEGVTSLENGAFRSCDKLQTITFQGQSPITNIPNECFSYCSSLETLTLPDAVQTVESYAFYDCTSLKEVNFGTGLTTLPNDWYLFGYCDQLRRVTLPGTNYPFTASIWFPNNVTLFVHPDLVETYLSNDFTKNYHVVALGQLTNFNITTTEGSQLQNEIEALGDPLNVMTLKVTGYINGTDIDYLHTLSNLTVLDLKDARIVEGGDSYHQWEVASNGSASINPYYGPWNTENDVVGYAMFYNMPTLQQLLLPSVLNSIGDYAMAEADNLTRVDMPDGLQTIGKYVFYNNRNLRQAAIPASVTAIGANAYRYTGIEEVTVPVGVTRLEEYVFYDCNNLQKATLPDGITYIGNSAFSECDNLEDVNIPAQIENIGEYAFYNNAKRTTPIVLPATLKSIGYRAFSHNYIVESITFNEGLETIKGYAFSNCNAVKEIILPESITTLEYNAFEGCDAITEFRFPQNITIVPDGILYHCDQLQKVVLAEGTTRLGHDAFNYCPQLTDINVSTMNTLTSTGRYVFYNTGFTTMTLPNSITEMDYCPFQSCANLTSVNVPTGIDYVPYDFCESCPNLVSVTMHDGIRTIRHDAFYGCSSLQTIDLNDQITTIEYNAFRGCELLVLDKLPTALTFIGESAFYGDKAITAAIIVPTGVTKIDSYAFSGTSITAVTLPEAITSWGSGLFANCPQLKDVTLPQNITRITNYMFQNCTSLEQLQIPEAVKEIGYAAFDGSALTAIDLPETLTTIESYAFARTQLREFYVPDGMTGDPGSYTWENCKQLKTIHLGRNQDYSQLSSFTCLNGCDALELLRIYAGTPPSCSQYYMGYRTTCILEVPEDAVALYQEANVWREFKEIRGFFQGDVLADADFAVMQDLYQALDGANWKTPWDLSNNHRSMGKWYGVTTEGDYITAIDLSSQGLQGELPASVFTLSRMTTLNLSDNHIRADLTTLLASVSENEQLTELNLKGNELAGDIYPFAIKLPNLTSLDLSYNQLTAVSQVIPNNKLTNINFSRGFQFINWQTREVVDDAPVIDMRPGIPVAVESNTLQTYRHEYGDYGFTFSDLAHLVNRSGNWNYSWELSRNGEGLWDLYSGWNNYVLQAPKGEVQAYTHANPWWSYITYFFRFDWEDGDVNADQTVDVADLQSVIYYALHDSKASGQMFNFTTADSNSDNAINVSDVVGSVDYVLGYEEPVQARSPYYSKAATERNLLLVEGRGVRLANADAVAALQLTVSGITSGQLQVNDELRQNFSVAVRDVDDGVRLVLYSANGHTLTPGQYMLLTDLPAGASVSDFRLADSQARRLSAGIMGEVTGIDSLTIPTSSDMPVYDLSGRRLGAWENLPEGIYVIRVNGKQYKVKK